MVFHLLANAFKGRSIEDISVAEISSVLHSPFDALFAADKESFIPGFNVNVWSEGGCFLPAPEKVAPPPIVSHDQSVVQLYCRSLDDAVAQITTKLEEGRIPSIALPCGAGKSTKLMTRLAQARMGAHVISVQPTPTVAIQLAHYQIKQGANAHFGVDKTPLSVSYICAGEFINHVAAGDTFENALVVLDEEHMSTPVHHAILQDALPRIKAKVVKMTASRTQDLPKRSGVASKQVTSLSAKYINQLKTENEVLVVGVDDDGVQHVPGSAITGMNVSAPIAIDTGRRLNPSYTETSIIASERVATVLELTQTLGRVNRLGGHRKAGQFYYMHNPAVARCKSTSASYYGLVYQALHTMFTRPDVRQNYAPILSGTSTRFIVPLPGGARSDDSRSVKSYKTTSSAHSSHSQLDTYVSLKPSSAVRGWASTTKPIERDVGWVGASTWFAAKPSAMHLESAGSRTITLNAELDNILLDMRYQDITVASNVDESSIADANNIMCGRRIPVYDDDEICAVVYATKQWLNASISVRPDKVLLNRIRDYLISAKRARNMRLNT